MKKILKILKTSLPNLADNFSLIQNAGDSTLTYDKGVINTTSGNNTSTPTRPRIKFDNLTVGKTYNFSISHTVNIGTLDWAFYSGTSYEVNGSSLLTSSFSFTVNAANVFLAYDGQNNNFNITSQLTITE